MFWKINKFISLVAYNHDLEDSETSTKSYTEQNRGCNLIFVQEAKTESPILYKLS